MGNRTVLWLKRIFILGLSASILLAALLGGAAWYLKQWGNKPLNVDQVQTLVVSPGSNLYRISNDLSKSGLIEQARFLRWYARIQGLGKLIQAGEYQVEVGMTPDELIWAIQSGKVIQYSVTLVNGHRFQDFLQALKASAKLEHGEQKIAAEPLLKSFGSDKEHPEGLFYPDTYHFHRGDSDVDILRRSYRRMQSQLQKAWEGREKGLPYSSSYDALIMASIVEKETAVPSERAEIAGVFVNRLRKGMRLQTDPTVIYGLGDQYKGNITRAHLRAHTPYNTYRIKGLPPTPIANPALPAIEAALHPAQTKALYFVAKGDGSHQFSETLAEHEKAVQQYQRQRRSDYRSTPNKP